MLKLGALALLLIGSNAFAQSAPYQYVVRPGDTLLSLARLYMTRQNDYLTVQKLNRVADPRKLPIGDTLLIPYPLLRSEPVIAEVSSFRGTVTVDGQPAAIGTKVRQGMRVETSASAFVTVRMPDGSAISLPSQSRIYVAKLRHILVGGIERTFVLEAGRSRSTVTPMKDPASNFLVTTPLSVSAVRGTDFRVGLEPDGQRVMTEVVGGTVAVATAQDMPSIKVAKNFGIIATTAGLDAVMPLLPPPLLVRIERTATGANVVAKPVDGAARYRTQLATDINFHDIFDEAVTDTPGASFTLDDGATFFVRLTAIAASGLEGLPGTYALGRSGALERSAEANRSATSIAHAD